MIYDIGTLVNGYIDKSGNLNSTNAGPGAYSSDYINVGANKKLVLECTDIITEKRYAEYTSDKTFISRNINAPDNFTTSETTQYIRLTFSASVENATIVKEAVVLKDYGTTDAKTITLDKTNINLVVGSTKQLTATVLPDTALDKTITWSTNNSNIATVEDGLVTAVGVGSAIITATTSNGITATCNVTVTATNVSVTSVSLNKATSSLEIGNIETLTATISPSNATNQNVTWHSNSTSIATVSSTGDVTAISPGQATITVTTEDGNHTASCIFTITEPTIIGNTVDYTNKYNIPWLLNKKYNNYNSYRFYGKKYYSLGDSIVANDETRKGYQTHIAEQFGTINSNFGRGGETVVSMLSTYLNYDYSDVALVTIGFGVNDARTNITLGKLGGYTDTSFDKTTFIGAYRTLLNRIYSNNPECRVVLLTPLQRLFVTNFGCDTKNAQGYTLLDYADAIIEIGRLYSTPVCDMYRNSGLNQTNLRYYTTDGVHPNAAGYVRMANLLMHELNKF